MDNILTIIYEYSYNHKLLDKKAYTVLLDELLKLNNLNKQIGYNVTDKKRWDTSMGDRHILGEYDFLNTIYIYLNEINSFIEDDKWQTKYHKAVELDSFEEYLAKNLFIMETAIHEVNHVKQVELVKDNSNDSIEKVLVVYELSYILPTFNFKITLKAYSEFLS